MIPLKDTVRARQFPIVNTGIIVVNVLVFIYQTQMSPAVAQDFVQQYGIVPSRLLENPFPTEWLTLFTTQFLHGGWLHLIGNMLALYIFGDNVEDRLGHLRYLVFYLLAGLGAGLLHVLLNADAVLPAVGASGSISGVMAAYLVLFPRAWVTALVPIFFIPWFIDIPAIIWIGFWFVSQLFNGIFSLGANTQELGGVAWWAHVGGFAVGFVLVWIMRRPARRYYPDEYWPW